MEVFYKTPEQNTVGEKRIAELRNGAVMAVSPNFSGCYQGMPIHAGVEISDITLPRMGTLSDGALIGNLPSPWMSGGVNISNFERKGFDVPLKSLGGKTINQLRRAGVFNAIMAGNTLPTEWAHLFDALRIDITIRKEGRPTVREFFYNMSSNPGASLTANISELYPAAMPFEEVTGTGQAVPLGEIRAGEYDSVTHKIYAVGLMTDLIMSLFNQMYDETRITDAVVTGENGLKDELALSPIFSYSYATEAQSSADTTAGKTKYELLYQTLDTALSDFSVRLDPITGRQLGRRNLVCLTSPLWAERIAGVVAGNSFPTNNGTGTYPALQGIEKIVGYEPETIIGSERTITYTEVPDNTAYLIHPNRRMLISIKRNLQLNVSQNPSPQTLAEAFRAWWFCEGIYTAGIADFVQEVTLPTWADTAAS